MAVIVENNDDALFRDTLERVSGFISESQRCIIVTGAGISVSGGIPVSSMVFFYFGSLVNDNLRRIFVQTMVSITW